MRKTARSFIYEKYLPFHLPLQRLIQPPCFDQQHQDNPVWIYYLCCLFAYSCPTVINTTRFDQTNGQRKNVRKGKLNNGYVRLGKCMRRFETKMVHKICMEEMKVCVCRKRKTHHIFCTSIFFLSRVMYTRCRPRGASRVPWDYPNWVHFSPIFVNQ